MNENLLRKNIRTLLPSLVIESDSFKNNEEKMNFIAHQGGACRCPACQGKIAVYKKAMGAHSGEPAIKKFTCTCDYSNDSIGYCSALYGISNGEAFKMLKDRVLGINTEILESIREQQKIAQETARRQTDSNIQTIRDNTLWGRAMTDEQLALLSSRALDIASLEKDGVLERIGYISEQEIHSQKSDRTFIVSGFVFNKENGIKIRKTRDYPHPAFKTGHKLRFLSYGYSDAFGSQNLKEEDTAVYVTEGEFDALSLISHGAKAIALSGVSNHRAFDRYTQKEDPQKNRVYIIAFDGDEAGESNTPSFINYLKGNGYKCFAFNLHNSEKDINDLDQKNPEQLIARINISSMLAKTYAGNGLSENGLSEMLSSWQKIDALAKVNKNTALGQYSRFYRQVKDICSLTPNNNSREKEYERQDIISKEKSVSNALSKA